MPGLLDYVKGYQHGGSVDFDPYANTSQADMLAKLGITVDSDAMGLLPTYDPTGADMARESYDLRGQSFGLQKDALALRGRGLDASLDTARRGSTGSLFDLTKQTQQQQGSTGFAGSGAGVQAMTNVRSDIVSGFGDVSSDIGRRKEGIAGELSGIGLDESQSYLNLQEDIYGMQQGYESDLLGAVGDLGEDDWSFGNINTDNTSGITDTERDPCGGQCGNHSPGTEAYNTCMQMCEDGAGAGGGTGGDDPFVPQYGEGNCPSGYYWDDALSKCQQGSGSGSGSSTDRP